MLPQLTLHLHLHLRIVIDIFLKARIFIGRARLRRLFVGITPIALLIVLPLAVSLLRRGGRVIAALGVRFHDYLYVLVN